MIRRRARDLQPGDVIGSGETVVSVQVGLRTPKGKVEVYLSYASRNNPRIGIWNASTMIRVKEKVA